MMKLKPSLTLDVAGIIMDTAGIWARKTLHDGGVLDAR